MMITQTHSPLSGLGDPGTSGQTCEKAGVLGRFRAIHFYIRTPSTFSGIPGPDLLPTSTMTLKQGEVIREQGKTAIATHSGLETGPCLLGREGTVALQSEHWGGEWRYSQFVHKLVQAIYEAWLA